MDIKLLLIRVITLLYFESLAENKGTSSSHHLAEEVLSFVKPADAATAADFSKDPANKLRDIVTWMLEQPVGTAFVKSDLVQRLRIATETEDYIFEAALMALKEDLKEEELRQIINTARNEIIQFTNRAQVTATIKEAYYQAAFHTGTVNWTTFTADVITKLEPLKHVGEIDKSTLLETINFDDVESVAQAFKDSIELIKPDGLIRFGWQGFNRMFGIGGARRGEMIVLGALQSNFKSGTTLEMIKSAALYNHPFMKDPSKKPLLLRISLENSAVNDLTHIYRSLIEPEINATVDETKIDPVEAALYVYERLKVNGYTLRVEHHNPSEFTIYKLQEIIDKYEREGYEIHMLNIDYLAMMSTVGCKQGATGQDIRDLFRRVRNITNAKEILCVTPHQLSVDAKKKMRDGITEADFVREIANKGYWDSCSTIDQEVDMEINQHLVKIGNETWVTWQRGKHRRPGRPTPFEDLYTVYKFGEVGYIPDDVLGTDMSRKRVAAATTAEGGEGAWWD